MALVSVVLPVYNGEKYIAQAVKSILDQTLPDFNFIIINDASTDATLEILRSFDDPRICIVNNEVNMGVVKSLNKGLELAQGDFIARMDADDISHRTRFTKQVAFLRENTSIDICGTWVNVFGSRNYIRKPFLKHQDIKAELLFSNQLIHPSIMIRRKSFLEHEIRFDDQVINCEDYALWVELIDKLKFANLPEVLLDYRIHEENFSVPKVSNWKLIRHLNEINYETLFKRMKVDYNQRELSLHLNLGFRLMNNLSKAAFNEYLAWIAKLVSANRKSGYFNQASLNKAAVHQILALGTKKASNAPGAYYDLIIKTLLQSRLLLPFISFRMKFIVEAFRKRANGNNTKDEDLPVLNSLHSP